MLQRGIGRTVKFYPQVQFVTRNGQYSYFARQLDQASGLKESLKEVSPVEDIPDLRKRLDYRFWRALADKDWDRWQSVSELYHSHALPMDEVSFTLLLHGHLMSHRHASSAALLVLDQMESEVHPVITGLNRSLINSFFELSELGVRSSLNGWQNLVRLAWMSAARLRKKRMARVKERLQQMETREVLKIELADVQALMQAEHEEAEQALLDY